MKKTKSLRGKLIKKICKSLADSLILEMHSHACKLIQDELDKHLSFKTTINYDLHNDSNFFIAKIFFMDENKVHRCMDLVIGNKQTFNEFNSDIECK